MVRKYYDWDWQLGQNKAGGTPYTPSIPLLYGLRETLDLLMDEGISDVVARHQRCACCFVCCACIHVVCDLCRCCMICRCGLDARSALTTKRFHSILVQYQIVSRQPNHRLAEGTRRAVAGWGLDLLCKEKRWKSDSLTVVEVPSSINADDVVLSAYSRYNLSLGVGLAKVQTKPLLLDCCFWSVESISDCSRLQNSQIRS